MVRTRSRRVWAVALVAGSVRLACPTAASGQSERDALAAGRALFADALADEGAGRLQVALEKFVQVKAVRNTAPVEYRIGTCQEGLGHLPLAFEAYQEAVALGEGDRTMADVTGAARERVEALSRHVARLTIVAPDAATADVAVEVDDTPVPRETLGKPIPLEPGAHSVVATAAGRVAFRSGIVLPEGGEASLPLVFPEPSLAPLAVDRSTGAAPPGHTLGWVLVGVGAALIAGSGVALLLRHDDIGTLTSACPGGECRPGANASDLDATRDRALVEGPLAAGLGAGGVVAAALGAYLILARGAPSGPGIRASGLGVAGAF